MGHSGDLPGRMAIPLAFLYTRNRSAVEGATRFQKLVFLAQKENDLPEEYEYEADKFGPFSAQLHSDIHSLLNQGYVEKNETLNGVGNTVHVFSLTTKGIRAARDFAQRDRSGRIFDSTKAVKRRWGDERIDHLIRYVYNKYDDYATETDLDLDRLFDSDSNSQFLEPEQGQEEEDADYIGPGPGEWKDLNPSAEELFSTK